MNDKMKKGGRKPPFLFVLSVLRESTYGRTRQTDTVIFYEPLIPYARTGQTSGNPRQNASRFSV